MIQNADGNIVGEINQRANYDMFYTFEGNANDLPNAMSFLSK